MKNDELRDSFCPKEWNDVKYLDEFDKRVIGAMLYSLAVSNEAKDWTLIKDMESLRRYCGIGKNKLYEVCNKLELIGFFKWERGEKRQEGRKNKAAHFYLNPDLIFNPPVEMPSLRDMLFQKFTTQYCNNNSKVKDNNKSNNNINNNVKENGKGNLNSNEKVNEKINNKFNSNGKENLNEKVKPEEEVKEIIKKETVSRSVKRTSIKEITDKEGKSISHLIWDICNEEGTEALLNWFNSIKLSLDEKESNYLESLVEQTINVCKCVEPSVVEEEVELPF